MSLLNIGLRDLPNLYVDQVYLSQKDERDVPKIKVSLVLKDVLVNNRLYWSQDPKIINYSKVVVILEDKQGNEYLTIKEPLSGAIQNQSSQIDPSGNVLYFYKIEKTIDINLPYLQDKSLVLKTYVESTNDVEFSYKSSVMREVVQNTDGSIPKRSFYFTLPSGERYVGPYHYHSKTRSYMLGSAHTNEYHPKLVLNYTKNKTISFNNAQKALSYVNKNKNKYNFNPRTIIRNYITKNNDRTMSNLFVIDLYKILLSVDEQAQKIYELNKGLFYDITDQLRISEMNIGRVLIGRNERENILYTPIVKYGEVGHEQHLITLSDIKEGSYISENAEVEAYMDDNVLYTLLTDNQILKEAEGRYKYVADLKLKSTVYQYIKDRLKSLDSVVVYYELFLQSLNNPKKYDFSYNRLSDSYIREIFGRYTDFERTDSHGEIQMDQEPEFHKHIEIILDNLVLLKEVPEDERQGLYDELDQLISPLTTNQEKIYNFLKICRDLHYQISSAYKTNKEIKNRPMQGQSNLLKISLRQNRSFLYSNRKKSFKMFKKLKKPIISLSAMKKRFTTERSRYFQKNLGDTSFNLLPSPLRPAFKSSKESRYKYLSPIALQTPEAEIDLENFDIFDGIADGLYENANISVEKKIDSTLTLLNKNESHLDAANFLGEASDFVINKINIRKNASHTIDPMVLNYSVSLNNIVDIDDNKFDLNKQENLLLAYVKNQPAPQAKMSLRDMPFQTKSLFYPDNIKNPLNRIKASKNFKVKRIIKSVAFTTYKLEYLDGYVNRDKDLRNIHRPIWKEMQDPSKIKMNSKYFLVKMTNNDRFGFRGSREFASTQSFVLVKNKNYIPEYRKKINTSFKKRYNMDDFSLRSYEVLNILDDDMNKTTNLGKFDELTKETSEWSNKRYSLLSSITNSSAVNKRARKRDTPQPSPSNETTGGY